MYLLICSWIGLFIDLLIYSFIGWLISWFIDLLNYRRIEDIVVDSFIALWIYWFINGLVYLYLYIYMDLWIYWLGDLLICCFIDSLIYRCIDLSSYRFIDLWINEVSPTRSTAERVGGYKQLSHKTKRDHIPFQFNTQANTFIMFYRGA